MSRALSSWSGVGRTILLQPIQGTFSPYLSRVSVLTTLDFAEAYDLIARADSDLSACIEYLKTNNVNSSTHRPINSVLKGKRPFQESSSSHFSKKGKSVQTQSMASVDKSRKRRYPACEHCGRNHPGECWLKQGLCLGCGKPGHYRKKCPTNPEEPFPPAPVVSQAASARPAPSQRSTTRTSVCWTELSEQKLEGPDLVRETEEKVRLIRERLQVDSDRQKSYADLKLREIEYNVDDKVFLKISPWKKVLRFGGKGKLSPRYIGPHRITERVGPVAYRLELPPELNKIHDIFHVLMLKRYRSDPSHILTEGIVTLDEQLTCEEEPVQILAREREVAGVESFCRRKFRRKIFKTSITLRGRNVAAGRFAKSNQDAHMIDTNDIEEMATDTFLAQSSGGKSTSSNVGSSQGVKRKRRLDDTVIEGLVEEIGNVAKAIAKFNKVDDDAMFAKVMSVGEGYYERELGKAFEFLMRNETEARIFNAKSDNLKKIWIEEFLLSRLD
ncbi:unnamed protein product [Cuscuta campestris]|uniref:CCHC-type domain-containing protein n=1 Tax=Cuscuta campestris TaxID=132261 RepID=A0A484LNY0_9ASTE|nr:unnamed protein product [Cuscuta campestris]